MFGAARLVDWGAMDPVTIGTAVAVLAGKKLAETVGEQAGESGWGLANAILVKTRNWLSLTDKSAEARLISLEAANDPEGAVVEALAELVSERLEKAPDLAAELSDLVALARRDPELSLVLSRAGLAASPGSMAITQTSNGDRNIQVGYAGGAVHITGSTNETS